MLIEKKYDVTVCDPFLNENYYTTLPKDVKEKVKGYTNLDDALKEKPDTIIFATRHDEYKKFDIKKIPENTKIIDPWNMYSKK